MTSGILPPTSTFSGSEIEDALSLWQKSAPSDGLTFLEYKQKTDQKNIVCFLYSLIATPKFDEFLSSIKSFSTADDLQFGPELCGQDIFDKYLHDMNISSRFICLANNLKGSNVRTSLFLDNLFQEDQSMKQIPNFLNAMINFIDNANCWPYLPLPEDIPGFLFNNPLRQLFCSRRMGSVFPYLHVHPMIKGKSFQESILECDSLLDAPWAICFYANEDATNNICFSDIPKSIALPLGVDKKQFAQICQRCVAWQMSNAPDEKKQQVINAYHDAVTIETYIISGVVARDKNDNYIIILRNNITQFQEQSKQQSELFVLSAIYSKISPEN